MKGFIIVIVLLVLAIASVLTLRLLHTGHASTEALRRRDVTLELEMKARACLKGAPGCEESRIVRTTSWGELIYRTVRAKEGALEVGLAEERYVEKTGEEKIIVRPLTL